MERIPNSPVVRARSFTIEAGRRGFENVIWATEIPNTQAIIDATRRWTSSFVVGLDLCPFARRVARGGLIRHVVSSAVDAEELRAALAQELGTLAAAPIDEIETTLLIHPNALVRFSDYCDFLAVADRLVKSLGLRGVIQIASFHPGFEFAGAEPDDVASYTNRSPYPMLHLLREASISKAADGATDLCEIPRRNAAVLREMGRRKVLDLLASIAASSKEAIDVV